MKSFQKEVDANNFVAKDKYFRIMSCKKRQNTSKIRHFNRHHFTFEIKTTCFLHSETIKNNAYFSNISFRISLWDNIMNIINLNAPRNIKIIAIFNNTSWLIYYSLKKITWLFELIPRSIIFDPKLLDFFEYVNNLQF